jgi:hypothetical protein
MHPRAPGPPSLFGRCEFCRVGMSPYYQSLADVVYLDDDARQLGSGSWIRSGSFCATRQRSGPPRAVESAMGLGDSARVRSWSH